MRRLLYLALLFPVIALGAAVSWSRPADITAVKTRSGVCAAGTTCDAPTAATDGVALMDVSSIAVQVCADSGQTITDGAGLDVYYYDPVSALWGKSALALTVATGARCAWAEGDSPGHGIPILARRGRIAIIPNAMTVSSGGLTVWIFALSVSGAVQ